MAIKNGASAFPQAIVLRDGASITASYDAPYGGGMSLRDWFAGQMLAGLVQTDTVEYYNEKQIANFAELAYRFADALIVRREQS